MIERATYNAPDGQDIPVEIVERFLRGVVRVRLLKPYPSMGWPVGREFDTTSMRLTGARKEP